MTVPVKELNSLLRTVDLVLFDFDGPLCDVFAGHPAPDVARDLERIAGESFNTDDPLEVLRGAARRNIRALKAVEDQLIEAEVHAVSRSSPTPAGVEFLRACLAHDLRVGIVSNNSADAVLTFLAAQGLSTAVAPVVGRAPRRPDLMKPNVWPMQNALTMAHTSPRSAVYIGDSLTDIQVAQAVPMRCVAYANKPGKRELFEDHGGAVVIDTMRELTAALTRGRS